MFDISEEAVAYHQRRADEEAQLADRSRWGRLSHEELARLHSVRAMLLSAAITGQARYSIDKES